MEAVLDAGERASHAFMVSVGWKGGGSATALYAEWHLCFTDVREPIGRPKKRKTSDWSPSQSPLGVTSARAANQVPVQRKSRAMKQESEANQAPVRSASIIDKPGDFPPAQRQCCCSMSRSSPLDSTSASTSGASLERSTYTSVDTFRQPDDDQPTLSDLAIATFLEGLDTLEINTEDGLTANMLQTLNNGGAMSSNGAAPHHLGATAAPSQLSFNSLLDTQSSTSYAVPADLSWADPTWLLNPALYKPGQGSGMPTKPPSPVELKKGGPCPKTGKESCCCGDSEEQVKVMKRTAAKESRVHCVPNPNGQGCTCLCDVSVALINVRATLRQAREQSTEDQESKSGQASTLQLTLSASQAVADQCACSASCPTCRSDPSTSMSASLLISTALQIYIRAVRTLRQGLGEELDVSLGNFKPKPHNARRIALFAMKLELRDLRDAIAKVSKAATDAALAENRDMSTAENGQSARQMEGLDPIDNVVIRKLDQQLESLLSVVEGMNV
jgi:hypothetical protein